MGKVPDALSREIVAPKGIVLVTFGQYLPFVREPISERGLAGAKNPEDLDSEAACAIDRPLLKRACHWQVNHAEDG